MNHLLGMLLTMTCWVLRESLRIKVSILGSTMFCRVADSSTLVRWKDIGGWFAFDVPEVEVMVTSVSESTEITAT